MTTVRTGAPSTTEGAVSLETRLEMADVAMDVLLSKASASVGHSNAETVRSVAEAIRSATATDAEDVQPPAVPDSPEGVLRSAAALIRERGWTRWTLEDDDGRVCTRGAVLVAGGGPEGRHTKAAMSLLLARIQRECPWILNVAEWNDSPYGSRHGALRYLEMEG